MFSDSRILELAQHFVSAADEVYRLQKDQDPECLAFQQMLAPDGYVYRGSRQGIYVVSPANERLGSLNSLNADKVLKMLEGALSKWRTREEPKENVAVDAIDVSGSPAHRWEMSYPEDGLVLRCEKRDLPASWDSSDEKSVYWNRDFVWMSKREALGWVGEDRQAGATFELPEPLLDRLASLYIVDSVKGQTIPFAKREVRSAFLQGTIQEIDNGLITIVYEGEICCSSEGPWQAGDNYWKPKRTWPHGCRVRLYGEAVFDETAQAFVRFELLGLGKRWGRTQFNGRHAHLEPSPMGILFQKASSRPSERVAPAFINVYEVDWVRDP